MIKVLITIAVLAGLIWFNWDKLPQPVRTVLTDVKTVSSEVYENGKDMPDPVKDYVDEKVAPKAKKIKKILLD